MDSLLDEETIDSEFTDRAKHDEIHANLISELRTLEVTCTTSMECNSLRSRLQELLDEGDGIASAELEGLTH